MSYSELLRKTRDSSASFTRLVAGIASSGLRPNFKYLKKKPLVPLFVVYYRQHKIEDVKFSKIRVDGLDATDKLIQILRKKRAELLFSSGITIAGFNLLDFVRIYEELKIPSIVLIDHRPDLNKIKQALLKHFDDALTRINIIEKHPAFKELNDIYLECIGIDEQEAVKIIEFLRIFSKYPEPLRIAQLIARATYEYKIRRGSS